MAAHVASQILGGEPRFLDGVNTVGDVRQRLGVANGYTATLDGEPADDGDEVQDRSWVTFAPAVKGGRSVTIQVRK